ncbi:hypothetical protein PYJP_00970 [Pyrofollis japonicus]|uniref:hypothetical protein n=1 Tax=Pyrofollis japonicus TaxID=3060460 RepID=UPI00295A6324|nr:hypothetical protein [Pyrofollis japonicus]BEP16745.1 hypothetical protein PYJP_00970 [Pyrofollis japonicus]
MSVPKAIRALFIVLAVFASVYALIAASNASLWANSLAGKGATEWHRDLYSSLNSSLNGEPGTSLNTITTRLAQGVGDSQNYSGKIFECRIVITEKEYDHERGYCDAWIGGPYLYSLEGVSIQFCIYGQSFYTTLYFEEFAGLAPVLLLPENGSAVLSHAGKRPVTASESGCTLPLTGNHKDRVYFHVRFAYEEGTAWCDSFSGICYQYWRLYPVEIAGVATATQLGARQHPENYTPPSSTALGKLPPYAMYSGGSGEYSFCIPGQHFESDIPLAITPIIVTYPDKWSIGLAVHFYKAVICDIIHTSPRVRRISTRSFYWWFKDGDMTNYEMILSPG